MPSSQQRTAPTVPSSASQRARITAAFTRAGLGNLTGTIPMNAGGVWVARRLVAAIMAGLGSTPKGTKVVPVRAHNVRGDWVLGPGVTFGRRAIYYVHGSAYVICSARTHRSLAARLSAATGVPVFVVDYRLAPEHPFPAAAQDVEAGYRWLAAQGYDEADIVIAGDSAGGHLACDLLLAHADSDPLRPAGVVLFSPLIDLTFALAEGQERIRRDPAISAAAARRLVDLYTKAQDSTDPRLRLDFRRADRLPPFLVQVGGAEMLSADARHLDEQITSHGGTSTLEVWPEMMHVFQALPRLAPEANAALLRARDFIASVYESAVPADRKEVS